MEEFVRNYGYYGAALGILATGLGFPVPEEVPVLVAGAMANHDDIFIYLMLPICILSVVVGDLLLYTIGRVWGSRLVQVPLIRRRLLTPERFAAISANFQKYGVKILLFARVTPGIRTWIFLTAGITKLPLAKFVIADAIYAIPGVTILFFLGYYFTDSIIDMAKNDVYVRPIIVLVVLVGVGLYIAYRVLRKPMVTGNPTEMPPIVGPVTETLDGVADSVADKVLHHRSHPESPGEPPLPRATTPDYYKTLQVDENADVEVIQAAYKRLAFKHHPDRNFDGEPMMKLLNEAYETLSDPIRRRAYDAARKKATSTV